MLLKRIRGFLHVSATLSVLVVAGCGNNASKQPTEKADKVVEQFLDAWSRGEPLDKFAETNNSIQGTDPDWKAGHRLVSFLSAESKQSPDAADHFLCRVALSLKDRGGKTWEQQVVYDVQLGDKSIVRRASP